MNYDDINFVFIHSLSLKNINKIILKNKMILTILLGVSNIKF
jgi:hypothetical protein